VSKRNPKEIKNNLILELHIPDFQKAREFYSLFGFEELSYDPTSGGGSSLGYLVLQRKDTIGRSIINFYGDRPEVIKHDHFNQFPQDTPRGYEVEVTFPVDNVEKLWHEVKGKLIKKQISQELIKKRWGKSDFRIVDPFGFYIRFTELVDWGQ
jgi:lactoylglutathione lyase